MAGWVRAMSKQCLMDPSRSALDSPSFTLALHVEWGQPRWSEARGKLTSGRQNTLPTVWPRRTPRETHFFFSIQTSSMLARLRSASPQTFQN